MNEYLNSTEVIDWRHPAVAAQAKQLAGATAVETARRCFEFVRDEIRHSGDCQLNPVTCRASDVLAHRAGFCYAKSHLLAALLRAREIPAGLCYQRLLVDSVANPARYCLHGLCAVSLPGFGWYRVDPRGNKPGIDCQFTPPLERLACAASSPGEADLPGVWAEPLPQVVQALESHATWEQLASNLPDIDPAQVVGGSAPNEHAQRAKIQVVIPYHLRALAGVQQGALLLEIAGPVTQRSVLDALELRFPVLRGTIRDHTTQRRRAFLRLYACERDLSNESPDAPLPAPVVAGKEPYVVVSAIAGG